MSIATKLLVDQITPVIITLNEASNIARVLDVLGWAQRIVVIDSGSTDGTLEIIGRYPRAEVIHRPFDSFAAQCNFGLSQVRSEWVLSLDADYVLSEALVAELQGLRDTGGEAGYRARFVYCVHGKPLRGALYPPRTVLYRVKGARYSDEGHGHRVQLAGKVGALGGVIYHDDRKPLSRWLAAQQRYARIEASHLLKADRASLSRADRIRLMAWPAPILVLIYVLVVKGCLLDGWRGWFYALQRCLAETMLALELIDAELSE